jgi:hypothetical protein
MSRAKVTESIGDSLVVHIKRMPQGYLIFLVCDNADRT